MTSPAPAGAGRPAVAALALIAFIAGCVASFPFGLPPMSTAVIGGASALVTIGFAQLLSGDRAVGLVLLVLSGFAYAAAGLGASTLERWGGLGDLSAGQEPGGSLPGGGPASSGSVDQPQESTSSSPPEDEPEGGGGAGASATPASEVVSSASSGDSGSDAGGEGGGDGDPPATGKPTPTPTPTSTPSSSGKSGPGYVRLGIGRHTVSQATPTVSATVTSGPGGSQRLTISMGSMGRSSMSLDVFQPSGSTMLAGSFASPQDSMTQTTDLHPPYTGNYKIVLANKDTGKSATYSVYMTADGQEPWVLSDSVTSNPKITVSSVEGRACSGMDVAMQLTGAGEAVEVEIVSNSGETVTTGVSPDATGSDYINFDVNTETCTGESEKVGVVKVLGPGDSLITSTRLVLPN